MLIGTCYFPADYAASPHEVATAVERRGFSSLYLCEHTHIPARRETPFPRGGDLPRMYPHGHELFVAVTAALAATSTLQVGTGVGLLAQRDPIITAKQVASLDRLFGSRLVLGVGAGWNREEAANHGVDPRRRTAVLGERVAAMRTIWSEDDASYHGEFVDFDPIWSWPKPSVPPPVLVGGMGPTVEDRILSWGDGWLAQGLDAEGWAAFEQRLERLRRRARTLGRSRPRVTVFNADMSAEMVERYVRSGIDEVLVLLPDAGYDAVVRRLDELAHDLAGGPLSIAGPS